MSGWVQGIALVLIAVALEAFVDHLVDTYKVSRRDADPHDDGQRHSH